MNREKCYVLLSSAEPPAKRRRVELNGLDASLDLRKRTYQKLWTRQQQEIDGVIRDANVELLGQITQFIASATPGECSPKLPTGLIVTGSGGISHSTFFGQIQKSVIIAPDTVFVLLTAAEAPNLKTLLKTVIKKCTTQNDDSDAEDELLPRQTSSKLLSYDLRLLWDWCKDRNVQKVIVSFQDTEAFDAGLLADSLTLFNSWLDRIPFVLLFGIATSVDIFQDCLPRTAVRCLQAQSFDVVKSESVLERVFEASTFGNHVKLRVGPALSDMLLQRQRDHVQSIEAFVQALKYAYMCHFYGNSLSTFLSQDLQFDDVSPEDFNAVRNLPSFRKHAEALLQSGEFTHLRALLDCDIALYKEVVEQLQIGQNKITWSFGAVELLYKLRACMPNAVMLMHSALYVQTFAGKLGLSSILSELLLFIKRASSDVLLRLLDPVLNTLTYMPDGHENVFTTDFRDIQEKLKTLIGSNKPLTHPLRSEHDMRNETLRTTVVAHKVELSKRKSELSKDDASYTKLVMRFHHILETYFSDTLLALGDLFLHEILIYDLKSPHRDVFTPKPRFAIERALSTPHDYLDCSCCGATIQALCATQPPTAILYQLYLECGMVINAFDLWSAFQVVVGDQYEDEQMTMALFFRGLAELKYMGMLKQSGKKPGHLAKLAWKGL